MSEDTFLFLLGLSLIFIVMGVFATLDEFFQWIGRKKNERRNQKRLHRRLHW